MSLFGVSLEQFHEWRGRVQGIDARLDRLIDSLTTIDDRIKALESTPRADGSVDALAATVDRVASEASSELRSHENALEEIDRRLVQLTLATAEGIERVDRAERRIRSTVKRARAELAEDGYESPGLEAEAAELRLIDAGGSGDDQVPPLPEDVGSVEHPQPPGIPGHFSQEVLQALRGTA